MKDKMKTSFQLVSEMNVAFGNPKGDPLNIPWDRVAKQALNIPDEVGEMFIALGGHDKYSATADRIREAASAFKAALHVAYHNPSAAPDLHGVRDASRDVGVFNDGIPHFMGIDGDEDMRTVIRGVMTRFIKDEEDKAATIARHAAKGVTEVYFEGEYPTMIMKSAVDQPDAPRGKFLKSASYKEFPFYDVTNTVAAADDVAPAYSKLHIDITNWERAFWAQNVRRKGQGFVHVDDVIKNLTDAGIVVHDSFERAPVVLTHDEPVETVESVQEAPKYHTYYVRLNSGFEFRIAVRAVPYDDSEQLWWPQGFVDASEFIANRTIGEVILDKTAGGDPETIPPIVTLADLQAMGYLTTHRDPVRNRTVYSVTSKCYK